AWFGEQRRNVAGRALSLPVEQCLPSSSRIFVETAIRRRRRLQGKLIEVEGAKLWSHQVWIVSYISEAVACSDRELHRVVEPRIIESSLAVHLQVSNKTVPVCH